MSISDYNNISRINRDLFLFTPVPYRPTPTDKDYKRQWFYRHFMRKINDPSGHVIEVSDKQFKIFDRNPFYATVRIRWNISHPPVLEEGDGAVEFNRNQIRLGMKTISNLHRAINNLLEFHKSGGREPVGFLLEAGLRIDETGQVVREIDNTIIGRIKTKL